MISTDYKTYFFKNITVINGSIFKMMKDKTMRNQMMKKILSIYTQQDVQTICQK